MNIRRFTGVCAIVATLAATTGTAFAGKENPLGLISKASDLHIMAEKYKLKSGGVTESSFTRFLIRVQGSENLRKVFEYSLKRNVMVFIGNSFQYGKGYVQIDMRATDFVIREALCPCV